MKKKFVLRWRKPSDPLFFFFSFCFSLLSPQISPGNSVVVTDLNQRVLGVCQGPLGTKMKC